MFLKHLNSPWLPSSSPLRTHIHNRRWPLRNRTFLNSNINPNSSSLDIAMASITPRLSTSRLLNVNDSMGRVSIMLRIDNLARPSHLPSLSFYPLLPLREVSGLVIPRTKVNLATIKCH
jgi:hypothetical protein